MSSGVPISGETYNLTCTVESNVPPTVQWLYSNNSTSVVTNESGITVGTQRTTSSTTTLTLSFNPLRTSHRGQYTCQSTIDSPASTVNATRSVTAQGEYDSEINCLNMLGRVGVQRTGYKLTRRCKWQMCKLAYDIAIASSLKVLFQTQQSFEVSLTVSHCTTLYKPLQVA